VSQDTAGVVRFGRRRARGVLKRTRKSQPPIRAARISNVRTMNSGHERQSRGARGPGAVSDGRHARRNESTLSSDRHRSG